MATPELADEEMSRFAPILNRVWQEVAADGDAFLPRGGPRRVSGIIELVIDANRPQTLGGMSQADEKRLYQCNRSPKTAKWLRTMFKNS